MTPGVMTTVISPNYFYNAIVHGTIAGGYFSRIVGSAFSL